jgi:hypothetical protein
MISFIIIFGEEGQNFKDGTGRQALYVHHFRNFFQFSKISKISKDENDDDQLYNNIWGRRTKI